MNHIYKVLYRKPDGEYRSEQHSTGEKTVEATRNELIAEGNTFIGYAFICERKDADCNCQHLRHEGRYWSKTA